MLYEIINTTYVNKIGIESLIVAALVFALTVLLGKLIIPVLRAKKLNQPINSYVKEHASKSGTPTMGGICFIIASLVVMLAWILLENAGIIGNKTDSSLLIPMALTLCLGVGNAMIGFIDDYKKLIKKDNEGLSEKQKLVLQVVIAAAYLCMMGMTKNLPTAFHIPFTNLKLDLGFVAYPLYLLVIVGFVNSTNITDGLDGLASSVGVASSFGIILMSMISASLFLSVRPVGPRYVAVVAASLFGALLGFLVFNHYPAKVFMGDTGSLFFGGILVGAAFMINNPLLIVIAGFVFVFETISVMLQRAVFKLSGRKKRLFKMAPVHHHFEKCGWSEIKIVGIFSFVTVALCALAWFAI